MLCKFFDWRIKFKNRCYFFKVINFLWMFMSYKSNIFGQEKKITPGSAAKNGETIEKAYLIKAGAHGAIDNSRIENVEWLEAEKDGAEKNSYIGNVKHLITGYNGAHNNSIIKNAEVIKAEQTGVSFYSTIENVGLLETGFSGVSLYSTIKNAEVIKTGSSGASVKSYIENVEWLESKASAVSNNSTIKNAGVIKANNGAYNNSRIGQVKRLETWKDGASLNSRINLISKEAKVGGTLFSESHWNRAICNYVKAHTLDEKSYRSLIASDVVEAKNYNGLINVITPQEDKRFVTYSGDDWEEAKKALNDLEKTKALNFFNLSNYFNSRNEPFVIRNLENLLEIEKDLEKNIEGLSYDDIDKNYEYVKEFNELRDEYFAQALKAVKDISSKHNKKKIESFGQLYSSLNREAQEKLIKNLETGKKGHKPGRDIVNIAKNIGRYSVFLNEKEKRHGLENILTPKKSKEVKIPEDLIGSPYETHLKDIYNEYKKELVEVSHLAEKAGLEFSTSLAKTFKKLEYKRKNLGVEVSLNDTTYLKEKLEEELKTKKRDYTIKAVSALGWDRVVREYKKAMGEDVNPDELSQQQLGLLRLYTKEGRNEIIKLMKYGDEVYNLENNQSWLEEKGLDLERITSFEYSVTDIDGGDAEANVDEKKRELWLEMQNHLQKLNEITGNQYKIRPNSIEDFEGLKKEKPPKDEQAYSIFKELTKEKPNEYKGLENQLDGCVPKELNIKVASPLEKLYMGDYFPDSCLALEKVNGWSAASYSVDVNKPVLFAYDQNNNVVGRLSLGITEDNELTKLSKVYVNTQTKLEDYFEKALQEYSAHLGMEISQEGKLGVKCLEAKSFYSDL